MALNALTAIGKLTVANVAHRFGYKKLIGSPSVKQTNSELETFAADFGYNLALFNKGMMSQMQDDPTNTQAQCYIDTAATNVEIIAMSDVSQYVSEDGYYDDAVFLNLFKIMNIKYIQQLESCEYLAFLISLDGMLSNVSQAAAAGVNLATQLGTGF